MIRPDARILDLAGRLVASGDKCAHVSASETHEISDFIFGLEAEMGSAERLRREAAAIANQRVMRRGSPAIANVLDVLPQKLLDEVLDDARAALEAAIQESGPDFRYGGLCRAAIVFCNTVRRGGEPE